MTVRFWLIALVAALFIAGCVVAGRIHDHRPIHNAPAPVVTTTALFADRDEPEPDWVATLPDSPWWNADLGVPRPVPLGGGS